MSKQQANETRLRQHEHHATQYAAYQSEFHAEINKAKRLMRHLCLHADDACAITALKALPMEALARVPGALDLSRRDTGVH